VLDIYNRLWGRVVSGTRSDYKMDKDLGSKPRSTQLSHRNGYYNESSLQLYERKAGGASAIDSWDRFLRSTTFSASEGLMGIRLLQRTKWWRWMGVVWGVVTILIPTAVYAAGLSK
jgi:hypothetical protein